MKIGFIGCGNMGEAILKGILSNKEEKEVFVYEKSEDQMEKLLERYKIEKVEDEIKLVERSEVIFLGVKPNICNSVLEKIKDNLGKEKILISMAAGVTLESIEDIIDTDKKVVRIMPNTPAFVGEAMTSYTPNSNVNNSEEKVILKLLKTFGEVEKVEEGMIHAVIGASGSSPAYVFMFIEAMADAAVLYGMPRKKAYKFAAQAVLGSAKMVLDTGMHPGELKDMVCSPGGTTIEAVGELEKQGLKSSVIEAMKKCMDKSIKMSKKEG